MTTFDAPGGTPIIPFVGKGGGAGRNNTVAGNAGGSGGGGGSSPSGPANPSTGNSVPAGGTTYGNVGGISVAGGSVCWWWWRCWCCWNSRRKSRRLKYSR